MSKDQGQLSIGALSKATGVPTETLRTWERRYGVPTSARTPSGHRRYSFGTVDRIRLVTEALGLGIKASTALTVDVQSLREMIAHARGPGPARASDAPAPPLQSAALDSGLQGWFEHVERFESRAFERELRSAWGALGAKAFLGERVAPFLTELGARWASGALGVRHEHFASERLREFLSAQWRPLSDAATGPTYVLATPPGERHVLGLHLAALTVVMTGGRVVFLGAETPVDEIASAASHHAAEAVLLSAADGAAAGELQGALETLRQLLPTTTALVAGGAGFGGVTTDTPCFSDLRQLERWLQQRT